RLVAGERGARHGRYSSKYEQRPAVAVAEMARATRASRAVRTAVSHVAREGAAADGESSSPLVADGAAAAHVHAVDACDLAAVAPTAADGLFARESAAGEGRGPPGVGVDGAAEAVADKGGAIRDRAAVAAVGHVAGERATGHGGGRPERIDGAAEAAAAILA